MAEKLASLKKKGGGELKETVLWTNPSPNNANGFAAQAVALSDDITKYKLIKFTFNYNMNSSADSDKNMAFLSPEVIPNFSSIYRIATCICTSVNNREFFRSIYAGSDNSHISFAPCNMIQSNSSVSVNNMMCIPYQIIGLK